VSKKIEANLLRLGMTILTPERCQATPMHGQLGRDRSKISAGDVLLAIIEQLVGEGNALFSG